MFFLMTFASQFLKDAQRMAGDLRHRRIIRTALTHYEIARDQREMAFQSWESARQAAAETKWEAINHLDKYLEEFVSKIEARGTKVHWASTGTQAAEIILQIVREKQARSVIKSKSMTGEEVHLNDTLEKAGLEVVESDLGEFIMQLRHELPYHIVFPSMHLTRSEIRDLFQREFGSGTGILPVSSSDKLGPKTGTHRQDACATTFSNDPEELTMIARKVLRKKYLTADIGFTGANFAIAETGMISITENEGNARLTAALPRTMISLLGIEKILPKLSDLALFLPMLATAGTGQALTGYNSLFGGPRQYGECDGPEEFHVILLDNHRTELLADAEQRDALHCIRCGACLNVCPIFRNVGGHTYGTTYSGPIGSVITPHLRGLQDWKHLSAASSLCGACTETCPVKIDLHHHLLQNRRNAAAQQPTLKEQIGFKSFVQLANHPRLWAFTKRLARFTQPLQKLVNGTRLDPGYHWTQTRDLPDVAPETFKDWWRKRK